MGPLFIPKEDRAETGYYTQQSSQALRSQHLKEPEIVELYIDQSADFDQNFAIQHILSSKLLRI